MKTVLLTIIIIHATILAKYVIAQDTCPDPDENDRNHVMELFRDIRNPQKKVPNTIAEFIKLLPDGMRSNYVIMGESRSFQESNYENPRVLMKSKKSGVLASFTGHGRDDGLRGTEKLEFIIWNGPKNRFDFYEIDFPAEDPMKAPSQLTDIQKRPTVTQNPASCLNCHGSAVGTGETLNVNGEIKYVQGELGDEKVLDSSQARPNWDPYNFWQGQIPFNNDTLIANTEEAKTYLDLIRKIEGRPTPGQKPNPRLAALKPMVASKDLEKVLNKDGQYRLRDYKQYDGPGVAMFDSLTFLNLCRINRNLKNLPFYQNIKELLLGAVKGCDVTEMLPEEAKLKTEEYFQKRGVKGQDLLEALIKDTLQKQQSVAIDKESRQAYTFENFFKNKDPNLSEKQLSMLVENEMNGQERDNRELFENAKPIGSLRYILEPLGVHVDNWSMSIDSGTYSFADLLLLDEGVFENKEGLNCEDLGKRSREAFFNPQKNSENTLPVDLRYLYKKTCDEIFAPTTLEELSLTVAKSRVDDIMVQTKATLMMCVGCHSTGSNGAPSISFHNLDELKQEIRYTSKFPNGGLGASIINRINKPAGSKGHMPMGPASLTTDQKQYIRDFIGIVLEME